MYVSLGLSLPFSWHGCEENFLALHQDNLVGFLEVKVMKCEALLNLRFVGGSHPHTSSHSAPKKSSEFLNSYKSMVSGKQNLGIILQTHQILFLQILRGQFACKFSSLIVSGKHTDFQVVQLFLVLDRSGDFQALYMLKLKMKVHAFLLSHSQRLHLLQFLENVTKKNYISMDKEEIRFILKHDFSELGFE